MTERAAYWSGHLAAIEREGITTRAYATREGLSVGALGKEGTDHGFVGTIVV